MAIEFWLSYNNGAERLRLPVNPSVLSVRSPFGNTDIEISHFGEYTVIGERGAAELSFSSFFPLQYNESYCEYSTFPPPEECVAIIERWRDQRRPLRFVVAGTRINYAVTIRDFTYEVERAGNPGDIYYSLTMKEYRFLDVSAKPIPVTDPPKPAEKQRPPVVNLGEPKPAQTYTVKAGDSLYKVFGKNWPKIYEANRNIIGNNPNLIYPGQVLVIPT